MSRETMADLKQALMVAMSPGMERHGFRLVKSREWFIRKRDGVKDYFLLDFAVYDHLQVQPTVRLRVDQVEDIFHRTSGFEKQYQSETPTLAVTLQHLSGDLKLFECRVRGREDIAVVAAQLIRDFEEVALPYFAENGDLESIDALLNQDPEKDSVHYLAEELRCAHGLIVAKLVGRADYDRLVEVYRDRLRRYSDGFYLPRLEALIADLAQSVPSVADARQ